MRSKYWANLKILLPKLRNAYLPHNSLVKEKMKTQNEIDNSELPKGWKLVKLSDICTINPPKTKFVRSSEAKTTFIPMAAVDEYTGTVTKSEIVPYKKVAKGYTYFEENDVLFAKITPCMQNGKHIIARNLIDKIGFGTTEFHVLRPNENIIAEWIWYFIRQPSFLQEAISYFTGAVGQQRIPESFLLDYIVPFPSVADQKRITAKIQELMTEVKKLQSAISKSQSAIDSLFSSYLNQVFSSPEAKKWERKKLGEVCEVFSGSSAPQDEKYFKDGKYPLVRVSDLGNFIRTDNLVNIHDYINDIAVKELSLSKAEKGTILFPKSGAAILNNNRAILGKDAYIVSHLAAVKVKEGLTNINYIYYWLCQIDMVKHMENVGYPSLKLSTVAKIQISVPPIETQQQIGMDLKAKMSEIEKLKSKIYNQQSAIETLPQSILRKAFRGEL
ncbi:MAG: restriction endonuclease subunit S [Planctomycetota bacterium]